MKYLYLMMSIILVMSCNNRNESILNIFEKDQYVPVSSDFKIEEDSLGHPYLLSVVDSFLITHDPFELKHFTIFNNNTGKYIKRFGDIGMGPSEILFGSIGFADSPYFICYDEQKRSIYQYNVDSLINHPMIYAPNILSRLNIPQLLINRICLVDDSTYITLGLFEERYLYTLINRTNEVLNYYSDIYNSENNITTAQKFISNQGILRKHPSRKKYTSALFNSANIDFLEVEENRIKMINSLHYQHPTFKVSNDNAVDLNDDCLIGFIDITTTDNYVYALYSDNTIVSKNREQNKAVSNIILVFDWDGKPISKYILEKEVSYIAADIEKNSIFGIGMNDHLGYSIFEFKTLR